MSDRRQRANARRISDSLRRYARSVGEDVVWYEFDPASVEDVDGPDVGTSFDDDLYDEGGHQSRPGTNAVGQSVRWKAGVTVRVIQATLNEGAQEFREVGNYTVDTLRLVVPYDSLLRAGVSNSVDRGAHVNDRIGYDGRIFSVDSFNPRGRIAEVPGFTVTVECLEVKDDEIAVDALDWHALDTSSSGHAGYALGYASGY